MLVTTFRHARFSPLEDVTRMHLVGATGEFFDKRTILGRVYGLTERFAVHSDHRVRGDEKRVRVSGVQESRDRVRLGLAQATCKCLRCLVGLRRFVYVGGKNLEGEAERFQECSATRRGAPQHERERAAGRLPKAP